MFGVEPALPRTPAGIEPLQQVVCDASAAYTPPRTPFSCKPGPGPSAQGQCNESSVFVLSGAGSKYATRNLRMRADWRKCAAASLPTTSPPAAASLLFVSAATPLPPLTGMSPCSLLPIVGLSTEGEVPYHIDGST